MSPALNLERIPCRSTLESRHKNHEVKHFGKNCVSCPYLLKASLYQFKRVNKTLLKSSFICKSSNLIYVAICQGCKEEYTGELDCLVREEISIYRQHIRKPQYQQLAVEEHLCTCGDRKFHMLAFLNFLQKNKSHRKSYENYFIDKFKALLSKKN